MKTNEAERERAKQIIVEIIRQAGGEFHNKTNLFKAFWKAHLIYAEATGKHLSAWPIVRLPRGPGIDNFNQLLGELLRDEVLQAEQVEKGKFEGFVFRVNSSAPGWIPNLDEQCTAAIRGGAEFALSKTSSQVSKASHGRAWESAVNGGEINIYLDLMSDEEYAEFSGRMKEATSALDEIFKPEF